MVRFENRPWQILTMFEKITGFWPYQSKIKNFALRISSLSLLLIVIFGLMVRFVKEFNNTENLYIVIENMMILVVGYAILTKEVSVWCFDELRREILNRITLHFETIVDKDESQILRYYSDIGLIFSIRSIASIIGPITVFLTSPVVKMGFLYYFGHGELEKELPLFVDFFVDEEKYFFHIVALIFIALATNVLADIAFDLNFFLTIRHICALFEIVKFRLQRASEIFKQCHRNNKLSSSDEACAYKLISSAVDLHNEAFELTQSLDEAYKVSWFIILLINAIAIAPTPVLVSMYKHDLFELIRHSAAFFVFLIHFYVIYLQGQLTIDYSSSVFETCYDFCWYGATKRCRIAMTTMMCRSLKPCLLTGGNMFELSMETYSKMLKTAVSYISMFAAMDM